MSAIELLLGQPAAQAVGWALLHFVWQGALIGILTAGALALLRHSAADVRYVVSAIGLSLMFTMPVVTAVQTWNTATVERTDGSSSLMPTVAQSSSTAAVVSGEAPIASSLAISAGGVIEDAPAGVALIERIRLEPWLPVMVLGWLCGVAVLTLRLLSGWLWVQRMKSHGAMPAEDMWQHMAVRLSRRLHISRPVLLLESPLVDVPTVIGWIKPVVLLPASALAGLTPQQFEAILAHELAHIRRHDYLVNLLQTLVETLLFYHPAVWWLSHRIRIEREHCCDDLAVSLCGDPYTYAKALADLEDMRATGGRLVMAANGGSLLQRVRRLLGAPSHAGHEPGWLAGSAAVLVMLAITASALASETARAVPAAEPPTSAAPMNILDQEVPQPPQPPAPPVVAPAPVPPAPPAIPAAPAVPAEWPSMPPPPPVPAPAAVPPAPPSPVAAPVPPSPAAPPAPHAPPAPVLPPPPSMPAHPAVPPAPPIPSQPSVPPPPAIPAAPAVPAPPAPPAPPEPSVFGSRSQRSGNFTWSNNGERVELKYDGEIEFSDDDTDIKRLSPDGYLRISDGKWFGGHSVELRADSKGNITRRYWQGSSEKPFEPAGREWLAKTLPRFIRQSGIGAPARVARILKSGGPSAVLAEISRIEGAWGKRVYFSELLKTASLDAATTARVLDQAGREMSSDFELASLLIGSADRLLVDDTTRKAYFNAARSIDSDFEMRRVYSSALKKGPVAPALLAGILDAMQSIESDFEAATLLIQIVQQQPLDDTTRRPFFATVGTIGSDFEKRRVLSAVAARGDLPSATAAAMLESTATIGSDFEAATALLEVVKRQPIDGPLRTPFFRAAENIGSGHERGRVLRAVIDRPETSGETLVAALRAAGAMGGSFETSQVLLAAAARHNLTGEARDVYIDAAQRLGEYEQGRAMAALVRSERRK